MVTEVDVDTAVVVTVKLALGAPAGTVTRDGTLATPVLLLDRLTTAPPLGAGPLSVTVPVEGLPPVTLEGFRLNPERIGGTPVPALPSSTEIAMVCRLATARSCTPSPLRSPTVTYTGSLSTGKVCTAWKVPSPLPSSTEKVFSFTLATARSGLPSPLKSPTATPAGPLPTVNCDAGWKVPSPLPSSSETLLEGETEQSREQP